MKKVFVGHRGVGKTTLLKRHQNYFLQVPHFDLDSEIEKSESKSIFEIFKTLGESEFRKIEKRIFEKLIQNAEFVIALGAGFDCQNISKDIEVIFISRRTDSDGRIFLNRPRLNSELSALDEYDLRFKERDSVFRQNADFIYHMPEGIITNNGTEEKIFKINFEIKNAFVTLVPEKMQTLQKFTNIELRTDFFSDNEIIKLVSENQNNFLISYRTPTNEFKFKSGPIDWALELGQLPDHLKTQQLLVSNHDDSIEVAIEKFRSYQNFHQKLCPVITSWKQLQMGHQWQAEQPLVRSFLPRTEKNSRKSQWRWYRQLQFSKQKINFIQNHLDLDDQPSLYEYLTSRQKNFFTAVLGDPVHHSKTPITQTQNFHLDVFAIPIQEPDFEIAMPILQQLGLVAAAVTSPLKIKAGILCKLNCSINTIVLNNNFWIGTSTDEFGLKKMLEQVPDSINKNVFVWGGGGILDAIKKISPRAIFYSAQSQKPRIEDGLKIKPDILIWAAPRKPGIQFPPADWNPTYVIDLNYAENSMGLEYAQKIQTKYISGDILFYAQAEQQLQFWKENLQDLCK